MQMRELGRTGVRVSAACLGTMMYGEQIDEAEAHAQMDYARERGVNFIDTAEMYTVPPKPETQGETERIIGRWLKKSGARASLILATKASGRSPMAWVRPDALLEDGLVRLSRAQIDYAVEQSLQRLQTDYIDLYQLHWPDRGYRGFGFQVYQDYSDDFIAFETILESLARHVEAGRIRFIGLSNESPWGVMRFLAEAEKHGWPRMVSIQNAYNLVNRRFETGGLAEIGLREQVGLLAYSPLAQGFLTGKYRNGARPAGARRTLFDRLQRYEGPGAETAINAYLDLAAQLGVPPAALALKFVDTRPWVTTTIFGATSRAQLTANLDAFDLVWTDAMEQAANALQAAHPDPCP